MVLSDQAFMRYCKERGKRATAELKALPENRREDDNTQRVWAKFKKDLLTEVHSPV